MKAAIVMGSKSDYDVVKRAIDILESFEVETEVRIISAHRTPEAASNFLKRIDVLLRVCSLARNRYPLHATAHQGRPPRA